MQKFILKFNYLLPIALSGRLAMTRPDGKAWRPEAGK